MENMRTQVFISYSHRDARWLERIQVHLKPSVRESTIEVWVDTQKIKPGAIWAAEIESALAKAKVAILLISADFLASDFIHSNELPPLLRKADEDGTIIVPVIVSPSQFFHIEELTRFQAVNDPSKPLIDMTEGEREAVFVKLAQLVETAVGRQELRAQLDSVEYKVNEQQQLINQLVHYSMSASIFHHLCGITILYTYNYSNDESSRREMYFLRDHGFIRPKPPLDFLVFENLSGRNLVEVAEPTEIGRLCVKLRKAEIPSNMIDEKNKDNLRVDPSTL